MQDEHLKIVEINGIKIEVDLRNAKVISNYKVGDKVKILVKEYSNYESFPGVIVGFDDYNNLPTIIVMYICPGYSETKIKTAFVNKNNSDTEITTANSFDVSLNKDEILQKFESEIFGLEVKIKEVQAKRELFLTQFGKYFKDC